MKDILALQLEINKRQKKYYARKLFNIYVIKRTTQKIKASTVLFKLLALLNFNVVFKRTLPYAPKPRTTQCRPMSRLPQDVAPSPDKLSRGR